MLVSMLKPRALRGRSSKVIINPALIKEKLKFDDAFLVGIAKHVDRKQMHMYNTLSR